MPLIRILLGPIVMAMSLFGCIGPIVHEVTTDYPATFLNVVATPQPLDGRERFREIFSQIFEKEPVNQRPPGDCEQFLFLLDDEPRSNRHPQPLPAQLTRLRIVIVPGFLNECFADITLPFKDGIESLDDPRFNFDELIVSGLSGNDANAEEIAEFVEQLELDQDEKLVLIGYSKGSVDILHFLVNFPHLAKRVAAVVSVAGAINGSPLADRAKGIFGNWPRVILSGRCRTSNAMALNSLRTVVSMSWLAENPLPRSVSYFSIVAFADRNNINPILQTSYDLLSIIDPRNDGLLLISDQILPGGTLLGYVNADHLSVVLPLEDSNFIISGTVQAKLKFPRKVLLKAILLYIVEALQS